MDIKNLRDVFKKYKKLSISEISTVTKESKESLKPILNDWLSRGRISTKREVPLCASGGCSCSSESDSSICSAGINYYLWSNNDEQ